MPIGTQCGDRVCLGVIELPDTSNYMELEGFGVETDVRITVVKENRDLSLFDAVILSGTKNTQADLNYLATSGLAVAIREFAQDGGSVFGICAGYELLGTKVDRSVPGPEPDFVDGLGLLPAYTELLPQPQVKKVSGQVVHPRLSGLPVAGYDLCLGYTFPLKDSDILPLLQYTTHGDGLASPDLRIAGAHLYNIFWQDSFRNGWLNLLRRRKDLEEQEVIATPQCQDHCGENVSQFFKITPTR